MVLAESDISVAEDYDDTPMRKSGCSQILIGLESPTQEPLNGLETNSNWKYDKFNLYSDAIRIILISWYYR